MKKLYCFPNKQSQGFTIIELMIVLLIVGVVSAVGIPLFSTIVENNRLISQTNQTLGLLAYARSEASKRAGTTITICGTSNASTCNSTSWETGWLVINDVDGDRVVDSADGDAILQIGQPLAGGNTLRTTGFANAGFVQFNSTGAPSSAGTFILCDSRGASKAKGIVIGVIGQTRMAVDTNSNGVVETHGGAEVTCP